MPRTLNPPNVSIQKIIQPQRDAEGCKRMIQQKTGVAEKARANTAMKLFQ